MDSGVAEYLNRQQLGGQYQSEGVFTLDTLKMGRKMAAYQLPEQGLWLVKLIQAAVVLRADGVKIGFGKRSIRVDFCCERGPGAEQILDHVFHPGRSQERAISHLCTGLRACVAGDTERLSWEVRRPDQGCRAELTGESTKLVDCPASQDRKSHYTIELGRPGNRPQLKRALRHRVVDLVREVGDEYTAVVSRCWCSPIPVEIDGVDLETGIPHPAMRHLSDCREVGCGVDRYHMGDHWLALRPLEVEGTGKSFPLPYLRDLPTGEHFEVSVPVKPKQTFLKWPQIPGANALLLVSFASLALPGVDFILDGAVIDHENFSYQRPLRPLDRLLLPHQRQAVGYRLFVTIEPEQADLSGFGVRKLGEFLHRQIHSPLLDTLERLAVLLKHYRFAPDSSDQNGRWFNRLLAPLAQWNQGFTREEALRTLEQLLAYELQK